MIIPLFCLLSHTSSELCLAAAHAAEQICRLGPSAHQELINANWLLTNLFHPHSRCARPTGPAQHSTSSHQLKAMSTAETDLVRMGDSTHLANQ